MAPAPQPEPKPQAPEDGSPQDPRFVALIEVLRRAGMRQWQLRYSDDEEPVVWMAVGRWPQGDEAAAGITPYRAAFRLAEAVMDGGECAYCEKPTGVTDDWRADMPLANVFCWWTYDPEKQKFRRGCEGEKNSLRFGWDPKKGAKVSRNDPCPCGSGKKWKLCHGKGK